MKKILLLSAAVISLTIVSCRQEDEMLSPEDTATLKIIENSNHARYNSAQQTKDSVNVNVMSSSLVSDNTNDGDPVQPPK